MINHRIRIGGRQFILAATEDTESLKAQILRAVHGGGGFVAVHTAGDETVEVLITAQIAVWFEEVDDTSNAIPISANDAVPAGLVPGGAPFGDARFTDLQTDYEEFMYAS